MKSSGPELNKKVNVIYRIDIPVHIDAYTYNVLGKRFRMSEMIQNNMIREFKGRLLSFLQCRRFKTLRDMSPSADRTEAFKTLEKEYGLDRSSYDSAASKYQKHYSAHFDSQSVQKIGTRVKKSIDDFRFGNGKEIHFVKKDSLSTIEGKDYLTGIKYDVYTRTVEWVGLKIKLNPRKNDLYIETVLHEIETDHKNNIEPWISERSKIASLNCRLKRQGLKTESLPKKPKSKLRYACINRTWVRNKFKYSIQFVVDGIPPVLLNKAGEPRHTIAKGKEFGVDLGVSTAAVINEDMKMIFEPLSRPNAKIQNKIIRVQQKIDVKQRLNNPQNYNENGTAKKRNKILDDI